MFGMLLDMFGEVLWHIVDINHGAILVNESYISFPLKNKNFLLRCEFMKIKICTFAFLIWIFVLLVFRVHSKVQRLVV